MKKNLFLMCLFISTMSIINANAQPPGKLVCGPVIFTSWLDPSDATYYQNTSEISFWEDSNGGYIYLKQDGDSQIISMSKIVSFDDDKVRFKSDGITLIIPRTKISIGTGFHKTSVILLVCQDNGAYDAISLLVAEFDRSGNIKDSLSKKSSKLISSFNSMVDYVNSIGGSNYSGFYTDKRKRSSSSLFKTKEQ